MRAAPSVLVTFLLSTSCVPDVGDDLSTVSEPRLLALQADPAEVKTAGAVTLHALVAAPQGTPTPDVQWQLCIDRKPLTELGPVSPACLVPGVMDVATPIGRGDTVDLTIPRDACSLFGPDPPPRKEGEAAGRPADPDTTGGYYQPVVAFLGASERALGAVRLDCGLADAVPDQKIEYRTRYRPNENPVIRALRRVGNGAAELSPESAGAAQLVVARRERVRLEAEWAVCPRNSVCGDGVCGEKEDMASCAADCTTPAGCTGAETYAWFDRDARQVVDRRESITVSWYSTAGDFDDRATGIAESDPDAARTRTIWTAPSKAGEVKLWVVISDDRGGVSWESYPVTVQ